MGDVKNTNKTNHKKPGNVKTSQPNCPIHYPEFTPSELELLVDILSTPNYSGHEHKLRRLIIKYAKGEGYKTQTDRCGNVYVTKGLIKPDEFAPLLNAHLDSVFHEHIKLIEKNLHLDISIATDIIKAFSPITERQCGCGMDDKNGVFIALMVMDRVEKCKIIFTVQEEIGMKGAIYSVNRKRNEFYKNIGFILAVDSPGVDVFSESFYDGPIFNRKSEFFIRSEKIIKKHIKDPVWQRHPWTCIVQLRSYLNVQGFNCPASYFNYHTNSEYTLLSAIIRTLYMCVEIIEELGFKTKYNLKNNIL